MNIIWFYKHLQNMSKFINSSVNYCETAVVKSKYLSNILELYNQHILKSSKNLIDNNKKYIIPNNNNKYYLFIVNKHDITSNNLNNKYKICYFFPDQHQQETDNILQKNIASDFYVEIDNYKTSFDKSNYLFEGYLYGTTSKTFLITDILAIDSKIITCDYALRFSLINKIMFKQHLYNLNGHLNINIHSVFYIDSNNDMNVQVLQFFNIFKNNFIFKQEINSIEYIDECSLRKTNKINQKKIENSIKRITKGKYIDVYNVYNMDTNNQENILYVKTLSDSKKLISLLEDNEYIELKCVYNTNFKKWQPIF